MEHKAGENTLKRLCTIGFVKVGEWRMEQGKISLICSAHGAATNALYAFSVDETVLYVGKTTQSLARRLQQYCAPDSSQRTNCRNRDAICDAIARGLTVAVYALPDSGLMHYGEFRLSVAAGLEDSIIEKLRPSWNGARRTTQKS